MVILSEFSRRLLSRCQSILRRPVLPRFHRVCAAGAGAEQGAGLEDPARGALGDQGRDAEEYAGQDAGRGEAPRGRGEEHGGHGRPLLATVWVAFHRTTLRRLHQESIRKPWSAWG